MAEERSVGTAVDRRVCVGLVDWRQCAGCDERAGGDPPAEDPPAEDPPGLTVTHEWGDEADISVRIYQAAGWSYALFYEDTIVTGGGTYVASVVTSPPESAGERTLRFSRDGYKHAILTFCVTGPVADPDQWVYDYEFTGGEATDPPPAYPPPADPPAEDPPASDPPPADPPAEEPPVDDTPSDIAELIAEFEDMSVVRYGLLEIDMAEHFNSADTMTYQIMVTTTHQRTGQEKTGALNSVARNKVRGTWDNTVLRLQGGRAAAQDLTLTITVTDAYGGTATGTFTLSLTE